MPLADIFWAMLGFFLLLAFISLIIPIFTDIFASDISGVAKAGWVALVFLFPVIGVVVYLIVRGGKMQERTPGRSTTAVRAQRDYVRGIAPR